MKFKIAKLLQDYEPKHSEFQIDNFIIGSNGNRWEQYKQALREIKSRYENLINLEENLQLFEFTPKWKTKLKFGKRARLKAQIEAKQQKRRHAVLLENIKHTERELNLFVEIADKLKKRFGHIDYDKRRALEADSWYQKVRKMAGVDLITNHGQLGRSTVEMILALPKKDRTIVLNEVATTKEPHKLLGL